MIQPPTPCPKKKMAKYSHTKIERQKEKTEAARGTHGCGMWKNIRKGAESFFGHVLYALGEGFHIQFWNDSWSSPTSLKELYPEQFACAMDKEARISYMVDIAPNGGGRSWNLLFCCEFQDWEMARFYAFFVHISSKIPKGG